MLNQTTEPSGWRRIPAIGLGAALALALSACGGGGEDDIYTPPSDSAAANQATAAEIAQESASDYDDNVNGLITGSTLKRWIDNWSANRPAGIGGKLVILQASSGESGYEFIKPDGTDVFTYSVPSSEWVETRSNGVVETVSMVPSGRGMDTFLAKYDIDPANDMIVCAQGTAGSSIMRAGRCWYMFRYWGTPKENVALLDGGNQWNGTTALNSSYFSTQSSTAPMSGSATVKDLPEINFALQATLEDMMDAAPSQDANLLNDGVFIWDARGPDQYSAGEDDGTGVPVADYMTTFQNGGSRQGHPNGTLELNFTNLVVTDEGWRYKSKSDLAAYLNGEEVDGARFIDSTYQPVGAGRAYQSGDTIYTYCETTFRAMVTGFASAAILGLPTRFYDGAMTEWNSMSNIVASDGEAILPWDSPWRTDKSQWSFFRASDDASKVSPRSIVNANASTANAIINEDLAYKGIEVDDGSGSGSDSGDSSGGSSGGGVTLPSNPCGG